MALFRENVGPQSVVDPGDDPDLLAMHSLMSETPEQTAEWAKEQGNVAVREAGEEGKKGRPVQRRACLHKAVDQYSTAIDLNAGTPQQRSVYFSNRAHTHLLLRNNGHALQDAATAADLDPTNLKAHYRAGKAAFLLRQYDKAVEHCARGLESARKGGGGAHQEMEKILSDARERLREEEEAAERSRGIIQSAQTLISAIQRRRVRMGVPQFQEATRGRRPRVDSTTGLVHWPVVLCYPEPMSLDLIEDFCETDALSTHVSQILGPDAEALEWDSAGAYRSDTVELYYHSGAVRPLSGSELLQHLLEDKAGLSPEDRDQALAQAETETVSSAPWNEWTEKQWRRVGQDSTLSSLLSLPDYVVPGVPVLYIVSTKTPFRKMFLKGEWKPPL